MRKLVYLKEENMEDANGRKANKQKSESGKKLNERKSDATSDEIRSQRSEIRSQRSETEP